MKTTFTLLCLAASVLFIGCNPPTETAQKAEMPAQLFTDNYRPPEFANSDRAQRVRALAPKIHTLIEAHAEDRKISGVAYGIVLDGELILSSATGLLDITNKTPASPTSAFRIASMTKSFTAMAIMKLRDEGKLSLADFAVQYIPEMANLNYLTSDAPAIRIVNLLTMTAGFPEDNPWGDRQLDESEQMLMDLIAGGAAFSTATAYQYEYSNTGYALLGIIISRVSGMPYQEYISKNILLPLGMVHTYWEYANIPKDMLALGYRWEDEKWKNEALLHDGVYGSMGGLITTIEDFSKYVNFHLSAWPPRGGAETGPVKRSTLREMQKPQYSRLYGKAENYNNEPCAVITGYGFGLSISQDCDGMIQVGHGGALPGFGSNYVFYPQYGLGIMAFGNRTYTSPYPLQKIKKLLFEKAGLEKRQLPVSEILAKRQEQVAAMIQQWDSALEAEILAENFYMDKSREHRMAQIKELLAEAGAIAGVNPINNYNELRGRFEMPAENGTINIYFTLTPEKDPKVQQLSVSFKPKEEE